MKPPAFKYVPARTVDEASAVLSEHYLLDVVVPRARRLLTG